MDIDKGETLFWKVIHNKYIFQYIIRCIEIGEWHIYDGNKQQLEKNRKKFKNIHSLKWMIDNKQYSLLKCKLEFGENITFDSECLKYICPFGKYQNSINEIEMEKTRQFEIFQLLLKYQLNEMIKLDLYSMVTGNLEAIKLLIKYNYPIQPNNILNEINSSSVLTVKEIINLIYNNGNSVMVPNKIKNSSILHAFGNIDHRDEMLKFILNNNQLYNIPTDKEEKEERIEKLETHNILYIKSKEIRNKLIQFNYFEPIDVEFISNLNGFKNKSQLLLELQQIFNNNDDSKCCFINNSRSFYEEHDFDPCYIAQNNIILEQANISEIYKYTLETFSSNGLQYLWSIRDIDNYHINIYITIINDLSSKRSAKEILEFIKIYTYHFKYFENGTTIQKIINMILSSTSNEQYQSFTSVISSNCKNNLIISKPYDFINVPWGPLIYNHDNVTKDKSSIDWLINNNFNSKSSNINYKFNTFELFEYANQNQFFTNQNQVLLYCIRIMKSSIKNCDIELFSKCLLFSNDTINLGNFTFSRQTQVHLRMYICSQLINQDVSNERIISFFNFINSFNGKQNSFSTNWSRIFFTIALKKIVNNQQTSTSLSTFFKSTNYIESSIKLFLCYTASFKSTIIQIFLENDFNPMKTHSELFLKFWDIQTKEGIFYDSVNHNLKNLYLNQGNGNIFYITSDESPDLIISFIKLLINRYNNDTDCRSSGAVGNNNGDYFKCIKTVISFIFNKLIQSKFTTIENVKYIRNFINNNFGQSFNFQHSIYQSYYYILLKSPRLLMLIMKLQSTIKKPTKTMDDQLDFISLIDPSIFTFEYLHGNNNDINNNGESFNNILDNLIQKLVYSSAIDHTELFKDYNLILQSTLIYLLEIKHYQSFFKQLEYIKQHLINSNITIGNFPSTFQNNDSNVVTRLFIPSDKLITIANNNLDIDSFNSFIQYFNK